MSSRKVDKLKTFILTASKEDTVDLPLEVVIDLIKEQMKLEPLRGLLEDDLLLKHSYGIVSILPENTQLDLLMQIIQKTRNTKVELALRVVLAESLRDTIKSLDEIRGTKLFSKQLKRIRKS